MNNFIKSPLTSCTPIKRIGLSRKRKSFGGRDVSVKQGTAENCTREKITKQDSENSNHLDTSVAEDLCYKPEKIVSDTRKSENLECTGDMKKKITELESLYSVWKNGCKNALLYLLHMLKNSKSEKIDVRELLQQLGVLNVISNHFIDDSDMDFCTSSSD